MSDERKGRRVNESGSGEGRKEPDWDKEERRTGDDGSGGEERGIKERGKKREKKRVRRRMKRRRGEWHNRTERPRQRQTGRQPLTEKKTNEKRGKRISDLTHTYQ